MIRFLRPVVILMIFAFDVLCLQSQSNDPFINTLKDKMASWCKASPFEDIYIHTDRETYIAGEYFWFNTYLFDRESMSLSSGSSYAYVELLDAENKPVSQTKVRLDNGSGGGGFRLPDTLSNGEYTLRAYTNFMKNYLPDGCFMKTVLVYNPLRETIFRKRTSGYSAENSPLNISFFPEGGRLLNNYINKVGVRVSYNGGGQKSFKGYLSDGINDSLVQVIIDSSGIGAFRFFAERGRVYRLLGEDRKNQYFLPVVGQTGYSLNMVQRENGTIRMVVNTEGVSGAGRNYFYALIRSRGNILYAQRINFSGNSTELLINENTLKPGINQVSVFDYEGNAVCSRLIFVPLYESEDIVIKAGEKYGKREKIRLEFDLDSLQVPKTDMSDFSLSVTAVNLPESSPDIIDYLITGSEYNASDGTSQYPSDIFRLSPELIDNYLLSLESNWINWEKIVQGKLPRTTFRAEKGKQFISGFYRARNKTENNFSKILFLSIPGKIPVFKYSETDAENRFIFEIRDNESSAEYVIQPATSDNSYSLQIESPFSQVYRESVYFYDSTMKSMPDELINMSVNYQVEKIYGNPDTGDTIKSAASLTKPIRFYGKPDQELIMSDYISLPVMEEVFFELVPGVMVKTGRSKYGIYIQDPVSRNYYETLPALLVDGVIINDPSIIINLEPELVEKIDVVKGQYVVGDIVFSGIVSVITKAGDLSNITLPPDAIRIREKSYDPVRKYKSPDYQPQSNFSRTPDLRNTIYWNHNLKPDSHGKITVDITTSDFASSYEIMLQGASGGKLFSARKTFRVE